MKYSERYKLIQAERRTKTVARTGSGGLLKPVESSSTEALSEKVEQLLSKVVIEEGVINSVMPLNEIILVSVRGHAEHDHEHDHVDDTEQGLLYNAHGMSESEVPLLSVLIPLINILPDINDLNIETLIGKPVKVYMSGNVAVQAELVSTLPNSNIHNSNISQQDIETASLLNIPVENYLRFIGHEEESITDYMALKAGDFKDGVIFRFKDEAYWDKDVAGAKGSDVFIEEAPKGLLGRNYQNMKTQLCHVPIIMFSGK